MVSNSNKKKLYKNHKYKQPRWSLYDLLGQGKGIRLTNIKLLFKMQYRDFSKIVSALEVFVWKMGYFSKLAK